MSFHDLIPLVCLQASSLVINGRQIYVEERRPNSGISRVGGGSKYSLAFILIFKYTLQHMHMPGCVRTLVCFVGGPVWVCVLISVFSCVITWSLNCSNIMFSSLKQWIIDFLLIIKQTVPSWPYGIQCSEARIIIVCHG